jgi:hypothetical protein
MAAASALLAGLFGCAGSGSPTAPGPATSLVYTPPTGSGYQLVADPASTATHLVLDLVGPSGAQLRGVVATLNADGAMAAWGNPGGASDPCLKAGPALALGTGTLLLRSLPAGSSLQVALFQKGATPAATLSGLPILSVALDLKAGTAPGAVSLSCTAAQILDAAGTTQATPLAVGTLAAR